jgi:hypothetical protein
MLSVRTIYVLSSLHLALKATTQSTIVSKLSAYARNNRTNRALWEYDNLIQSLYLLNYIDSASLRQNVQRAVNRGESYHQLRRTISYANYGKLRFAGICKKPLAAIKRGGIPGSSGWPVAICRPGPDPIESLAIALSRVANSGQGASALADLISELQKSGKTLHLTARRILPDSAVDMRTVIVVDQFEEVFTICRKDELRDAFIGNLLYAAKVAEGQTLVILTHAR